jgi:hypothetical protein
MPMVSPVFSPGGIFSMIRSKSDPKSLQIVVKFMPDLRKKQARHKKKA